MRLLISIFTLWLFFTSCQLNCEEGRKDIVRNDYLTSFDLNNYSYLPTDTISYLLDSIEYSSSHVTFYKYGVEETKIRTIDMDCGYHEYVQEEYFTLCFNNDNIPLKFFVNLFAENYSTTRINFVFGLPLDKEYSIYIKDSSKIDTLTLDNKIYNDVYIQEIKNENALVYYSKSKGLLKIEQDSTLFFKILY